MKRSSCLYIMLAGLLGACKHDPMPVPQKTCSTPETVSFSQHIMPLFNAQCNTAGCHSGSQPGGGLNLDSTHAYAELTKPGSGYIDTVTPTYSLLYAQMISVSEPMPPTGKLDQCSIDLVLKWIEQKAPNN